MKNKTNIILIGVGGQGVITAANILGKTAVKKKLTVYISETHGMAQRGGSVICTVRIGQVSGPLIAGGTADAFVSTEPIEALRYIQYANKKTKVITDISPVIPSTVSLGLEKYPKLEDVFNELNTWVELYTIDATAMAKLAGAVIAKNIVMLGALAATDILPFGSDILLQTILHNFPANYKEINIRAFNSGLKAIKKP